MGSTEKELQDQLYRMKQTEQQLRQTYEENQHALSTSPTVQEAEQMLRDGLISDQDFLEYKDKRKACETSVQMHGQVMQAVQQHIARIEEDIRRARNEMTIEEQQKFFASVSNWPKAWEPLNLSEEQSSGISKWYRQERDRLDSKHFAEIKRINSMHYLALIPFAIWTCPQQPNLFWDIVASIVLYLGVAIVWTVVSGACLAKPADADAPVTWKETVLKILLLGAVAFLLK